ncbi:MAG: type II secretion system F family protein [Eubacterium sp.]|nr:type II secretion system F family protein [Eubacterium sp.]
MANEKQEKHNASRAGNPDNLYLSAFCSQMATIIRSGIPALEGLAILKDDSEDADEKELFRKLFDSMSATGSLAQALTDSGSFPPYLCSMVRIGEESGRLDNVFSSLSSHYEREEDIKVSIRNALIYPLIMTGMMIAVIVVLLVYVLPVFSQVFRELGTEMSPFARGLMNIGNAFRAFAPVFLCIVTALILFLIWLNLTAGGRKIRYRMGSAFPGTRQNRQDVAACRFAGAMSMTLSSGLHPEQGLDLAADLIEDPDFSAKIDHCRKGLDEGKSLSDMLLDSGIFTGLYARMASIGWKTGSLDSVMEQIAGLYQDSIDARLAKRMSILEPALITILSVIVGITLLSVMFPLLGVMSGL